MAGQLDKIGRYLSPLLAWLIPLISFYFALAPGVQLEDSGELATAALTWGIAHPSGYPTYVLLGNLWAGLFGHTAAAINLLSAAAASLACFLVYKILSDAGVTRWLAILAAWLLAGFPSFWSQALLAEVYTLHAALVGAWLLASWRFYQTKQERWFYLAGLILGLSLGNHLITIFLLPVWLAIVYQQKAILSWRIIGQGLLFLLAGLAIYLYLPLAASLNPPLNWGNPATFKNFWQHVSRFNYHDFGFAASAGSKVGLVVAFMHEFIDGFGWPVVIISWLGLALWWRRRRRLAGILLAVVGLQSLPIIILRHYGWGIGMEFTYRVYWSGALVSLAVIFGLSANQCWQYVKLRWPHPRRPVKIIALGVSLLILPWSVWLQNWQIINYRQDNFPHHYAQALLAYLPPQAILFINTSGYAGDSLEFTLLYEQVVAGQRPDVLLVDAGAVLPLPVAIKIPPAATLPNQPLPGAAGAYTDVTSPLASLAAEGKIINDWFKVYWQIAEQSHRPLYSTSLPSLGEVGLVGKPDGYAYRIFGSVAEARLYPTKPALLKPELWHQTRLYLYSGQDYLAQLNYFQAAALLTRGRERAAQGALLEAIKYDNEPFSLDYKALVNHRRLLVPLFSH